MELEEEWLPFFQWNERLSTGTPEVSFVGQASLGK